MPDEWMIPGHGRPYGDIAYVNTPNTDRLAFSLYNEEKQRGIRLQNENAQLDNLLNKEFSKVRSADTEEIINKYNDYKNTKKQVLFDKKIQNDPRLYNAYNQAAGEKLADLYASINKSAEAKNAFEMTHQERKANPGKFSRDFYGTMNQYSQTPTSKLPINWQDKLRFEGNVSNFEPTLSKAEGMQRNLGEPIITQDGVQRKVLTYKGKNSAYEFYNHLIGGIVGSEQHDNFLGTFGNVSPEQEQQIDEQYHQLISDPTYRKLYGIPEGYDFPDSAYDTQVGRTARLMAEKHAIENQPSATVSFPVDTQEHLNQQLANQKEMEAIRQQNRQANLKKAYDYRIAAQDYKNSKTKEQENSVLNGLVDDQFNDGAKDTVDFTLYGKKYSGRVVKIPRSLQEKYSRKAEDGKTIKEYPDQFLMTDDKKYIVPIYWQKDTEHKDDEGGYSLPLKSESGATYIIAKKGEPILMSTYKADLGTEFLTKKQLSEELSDEFGPPPPSSKPPIVPPKEKTAPKKQTTKKNDPLGLF